MDDGLALGVRDADHVRIEQLARHHKDGIGRIASRQRSDDLDQIRIGRFLFGEGAGRRIQRFQDTSRLATAGSGKDCGVQRGLQLIGQTADKPGLERIDGHGLHISSDLDRLDQHVRAKGDRGDRISGIGGSRAHGDPACGIHGALHGDRDIARDIGHRNARQDRVPIEHADDSVERLGGDRSSGRHRRALLGAQAAALQMHEVGLAILRRINGEARLRRLSSARRFDRASGHDAGGDVGSQALTRLHFIQDLLALRIQGVGLVFQCGQRIAAGRLRLLLDGSQARIDFIKSHS